jgi:imidazolonepropionase
MSLLLTHIQQLLLAEENPRTAPLRGAELARLPLIENAWLLVEGSRIADFGPMESCPDRADRVVNAGGRLVLPAWVDSHTHLVFARSREEEWVDRLQGLSYEEIARRGGGILNSARRLREMPEEQLFEQSLERLQELIRHGTATLEIKSGYGLSTEGELKMLRVIRRLKETGLADIRATFLGAHAVPMEFREGRRQEYLDLLINDMLPRIAGEGLADYIDVFCEKVAFSVAETEQVLEAGARYGLKPKIHVNQFNCLGGIAAALRHGAVSVDHLEVLDDADLAALQSGQTIATLLPTAPFFLNDPPPPARRLVDAGVPLALASDFNPGTSPSGKMPFVLSLACIQLRLLPEEALQAATLNGAFALEWAEHCGSIARGKVASFIVTRPVPSLAFLPYSFSGDWVEAVYVRGERRAGGSL